MIENQNNPVEFSKYGYYQISDNLKLLLPNTEIRVLKIGKNVFSYSRKDADDNIVEKIIPSKSDLLDIELAPIRPLNTPAKRTNYVYLELETPIFLSQSSSATVFIRCPIEIGVFIVQGDDRDSLDCFSCDPINSRFCLYGPAESGTLCKYFKTQIVESHNDSIPYLNGVLQVDLSNELSKGLSIEKIVFPVTDNSVYYEDSKAVLDSIIAVLRKKLTIEILDVVPKSLEIDWKKSPTYEKIENIKRIDMGVD